MILHTVRDVSISVCVSVYTITKNNNSSTHWKLENIVVYENCLDEFDIGHYPIKVKVTACLCNFSPFTTLQAVKSYISALADVRKL